MRNIKIWLIALAAVITLHLFFNANKRYNINGTRIWGVTSQEYRDILKAAKTTGHKGDIYRNTQVLYFRSFPEETIYLFYPLYFIVVSGLILNINKKK